MIAPQPTTLDNEQAIVPPGMPSESEAEFEQTAAELLAAAEAASSGEDDMEAIDQIGLTLRGEFDTAEKLRQEREEEWIKDLRQYKGQYDPDVLAKIHPKRSKAFIRLTRSKVRSTDARMADMLFPAGDKNWTIQPTPVPSMSQELVGEYRQAITQRDGEVDEEALNEAIEEVAKERNGNMSKEIDDQLSEGNYPAVAREVLHSGHLFGTGILKGVMVDSTPQRRWTKKKLQNGSTISVMEEFVEHKPTYMACAIWNIYPDPYATTLSECEYIWERHVMTKHEVRKLAKRKGFKAERILKYLRENKKGNIFSLKHFEQDMRTISGTQTTLGAPDNKYEVLERWGYMDGQQLRDCGAEVSDAELDREFEAVFWLLGDVVIKASINPFESGARPYKFYYFEKDETSIWGVGIPSLMRDPQTLFNASIRMAVDNAAMSAGPQIEVNKELLYDDEDTSALTPFRLWLRRGRGADAGVPALRVYQIESKVGDFLNLAKLFMEFGDESTSIPRFTYGQVDSGSVSKTVGGLSMLMGQANITLKDVVKNWDDGITTPFITDLYNWNMQFSEKENIKGDFKVIARGSTSLVAKELRSHALDAFAGSTNNPIDGPYIKRGKLLQERARALDLNPDDLVKDEEEVTQQAEKDQQLAQMQNVLMQLSQRLGIPPEALMQGALPGEPQPAPAQQPAMMG